MTLKVLVVDDQATIRRIVSRLLCDFQADCVEASTAARALDILDIETFGLVITDWNMPGISGIDFLRMLRNREHLKTTPVVMMTGRNHQDDIDAAIRAGVSGYIVKPFGAQTFRVRIAQALELSVPTVPTAAESFNP